MTDANKIIEEYLTSGKGGDKFTDATAERKRGVIKNFLAYAGENGVILQSPTELVSIPKPKGMTTEEASKVRIMDVNPADFMRENVPKYKETKNEFKRLEAHMVAGKPLLLVGPKGIGKTLVIDAFANKNGIPLVRYDCSENTKAFDLIGRYMMIGDETVFQLGVLPTAILIANTSKHKKCIIVLEEMNALTNAMQKVLNQLLDYRNSIFVGGINKHYELEEGAQILMTATMNPSTYGGTHEVNEDLKSRFPTWKWNYPNEKEEKKIVNASDVPEGLVDKLMLLAKETRAAVVNNDISYALSTRDLDLFLDLYRTYDGVKGLDAFDLAFEECVMGKYDDEHEERWITARRNSIFPKGFLNPPPEEEVQKENQLREVAEKAEDLSRGDALADDDDFDDDEDDDF